MKQGCCIFAGSILLKVMRQFKFLIGLVLLSLSVHAQDAGTAKKDSGTVKKPGKKELKFEAADSSFLVKFGARFQTLYSGEYNFDTDKYADELQIRRFRLKLDGYAFSPKLEYKIELALSNSDMGGRVQPENNNTANLVLDAVAKWNFAKNASLWFGQTKLPGNRERVISSQKLQFVDRSLLNSRYNIDRDLGLQMHHEFEAGKVVFREALALTMGEGRNITTENKGGYDVTGRIEVLPFGAFTKEGDYSGASLERETEPKLAIGLTYDFNRLASRQGGQLGAFFPVRRNLNTLFADAMFKYRAVSVMAEYADKRSSGSPVVATDPTGRVTDAFFTGTGFNVQAGYLFDNNFEIAGRYTTINPEDLTQRLVNKQYTLGVSKYLKGHTVKMQSDISLLRERAENSNLMYRFQLEIGF